MWESFVPPMLVRNWWVKLETWFISWSRILGPAKSGNLNTGLKNFLKIPMCSFQLSMSHRLDQTLSHSNSGRWNTWLARNLRMLFVYDGCYRHFVFIRIYVYTVLLDSKSSLKILCSFQPSMSHLPDPTLSASNKKMCGRRNTWWATNLRIMFVYDATPRISYIWRNWCVYKCIKYR